MGRSLLASGYIELQSARLPRTIGRSFEAGSPSRTSSTAAPIVWPFPTGGQTMGSQS